MVRLRMKTKKLRIIKICLSTVAVVFPIVLCILPSLSGLQKNFWIWLGYMMYLLFTIFFISMFRGHKYDAKDIDNKEIQITQELLKERNKWGSFL